MNKIIDVQSLAKASWAALPIQGYQSVSVELISDIYLAAAGVIDAWFVISRCVPCLKLTE